MIIENLDSLKSWLIQTLTPICDADPDTLSKYVIALVKKEKPHDELKEVCFRELDVFLQDKTKAFVSKLFDALLSNSYLADLEARSKERATKEPLLIAPPHAPKEPARADQRPTEANYKPNQNFKPNQQPLADRKDPADFPVRQDGSLQKSRVMAPRDCLDDGVKMASVQESRGESGFHRLADVQKRPGAYPLRSPRAERGHHAGYNRSDMMPSGLDRGRIDTYDPMQQNDVRNRRPRPSSLNRRVENPNRRDYPLAAPPKHSGQDGRYPNERLRRFPSHEKVASSNPATRYNSPIRSPELDRTDDRYHPSQQQPPHQQPPWVQHHRELKHLPDTHERFSQPLRLRRSPFSRSRTRSRTASRTPSRSMDRTLAPRSSRSRSRSPGRSRSTSRTGRSSRSRSPTTDIALEKKPNLDQEVIDSRSSTPLEEEDYRASEPLLKIKYDTGRPLTRPRCRDYDDKGFCIRGDLCEFDHGTDPVVLKNEGYQSGLGPSLLPQGPPLMAPMPHMSRPMSQMPYPDHPQSMMPPTLQFSVSEAFPMMPPPFVTNRPMALRQEPVRNMAELYRPMMIPVEPYLPEPYTPKSTGYQATPKPDEKWESSNDVDPNFLTQRLGPVQISANRHTNLVRVPTDEVRTLSSTEDNQDASTAQKRAGLKRSADVLDAQSDSTATVTSNSVQPPPLKKTALEHPGVRHGGTNNTTLELRKIPREQNIIANINDHFSKFGIIVNLQVGWEGDPQAALVSFASNAQAQLAYRSQEPFLNNRFIKIFWHNAEKPAQNQPQTSSAPTADSSRQRIVIPERHKLQLNNTLKNAAQATKNAAENLAKQQPAAKNATALIKNANSTPNSTAEAAVAPPVASITSPPVAATPAVDARRTVPGTLPTGSTRMQRRPSKEMANKEVMVRHLELQKKSQELLQKQIEQQKVLLQKLERDKATLSADEKTSLIQTIKKLAKTIDEQKARCALIKPGPAKKGVAVGNKAMMTPAASLPLPGAMSKVNNVVRSLSNSGKVSTGLTSPSLLSKTPVFQDSQQTQKAILDTELDLMNRQKEGTDTSELRRRVMALKEEAASLGLLGPKPITGPKPGLVHGRGRGTALGRGRGVALVAARRWPVGATSHTVDRRPRQLLVTGFLAEEKEDLIAHLQEFGELDTSGCDTSIPSLSVTFKQRLSAEKAATEGCNFNGKKLKMVWQKPGSVLTERNVSTANAEPFTDKPGAKLLTEVIDDVGRNKPSVVNSLLNDEKREDVAGQGLKSEVHAAEESKSDAVEKAVRLDSVTGEEEEVDEDIFLGLDEEEDDDNNEGGRPWRR